MTRPALAARPAIRPASPGGAAVVPAADTQDTSHDLLHNRPDGSGRRTRVTLEAVPAAGDTTKPPAESAPQTPATGRTERSNSRRWMDGATRWLGQAWESLYAAVVLLAPLTVAGWFQAHAIHDRLTQPWTVAVGFTLAWEGAAGLAARLYVRTLLLGDSTVVLRLAMMVYAGVSCALLAWHLDAQGRPWYLAAAVGALTMSGIFLWARVARARYRAQLHAAGKVDAQIVRFSLAAWVASPLETPAALRFAIRHRIDQPSRAIAEYRAYRDGQRLAKALAVARAQARQRAIDVQELRDQALQEDALLRAALVEAGRLLGSGGRITRDALAPALRARGIPVSNERAGQLARQLSDELQEA